MTVLRIVPTHCIKHHFNQLAPSSLLSVCICLSHQRMAKKHFRKNYRNFNMVLFYQIFRNRQDFNDNVLHRKRRMERWYSRLFTYVSSEFLIKSKILIQNRTNWQFFYLEPPIINCEDEYMEAIIDKNMLRAKRWNGNANNIFLFDKVVP